jgi:hypothetical protein
MFTPAATARITEMAQFPLWSKHRNQTGLSRAVLLLLFCITPRGAKASATTYSIVESAKENGLKPFEYLTYLFTELPNATTRDLDEFLPWSQSLPDNCRILSK